MKNNLKIIKTTVNIGIEKPVKLLQLTDCHITRGDPTGWNRKGTFDVDYDGCAEDYFLQALEYAKTNGMPVLCTGDVIDFFSPENFEFIDKHLSGADYIYAAGNHDFCHMLGQAKEDYAYKWEKISEIAPHIKNNMYFFSRIVDGVNVVILDNSYYFITDGQIEALKAEAARGYPIILAMHVPLYTERTALCGMEGGEPAYVVAASQELLSSYSEERRLQQAPDAATLRAVEYIKNEPMIKAVFAGHKHLNIEDMLNERLPQYVTHGSFAGYVREITVC